jgi:hypothetical protein
LGPSKGRVYRLCSTQVRLGIDRIDLTSSTFVCGRRATRSPEGAPVEGDHGRARRPWAGAEADAIGYGGVAAVARATGMAISTVRKGRDEARAGAVPSDVVKIRRSSGTRSYEASHPEVWEKLESWSIRSRAATPNRRAVELARARQRSPASCPRSMAFGSATRRWASYFANTATAFRPRIGPSKASQHPDRNAQFEYINEKTALTGRLDLSRALTHSFISPRTHLGLDVFAARASSIFRGPFDHAACLSLSDMSASLRMQRRRGSRFEPRWLARSALRGAENQGVGCSS